MKTLRFVLAIAAVVVASVFLPTASGQSNLPTTWNSSVANTSGGCPAILAVNGITDLQCTMANAMVGVDPSTPPTDPVNGNPTDPSTLLTWRTVVRFFNRDTAIHTFAMQTFVPDGTKLYPVMWTQVGNTLLATTMQGYNFSPMNSVRLTFNGATPTTIATPFAVTLIAAQNAVDQLPDFVGETLVQQVDANGNVKKSYSAADPATVTTKPGTAFGVQMDLGYPNQDTTLTFSNPTMGLATVTVTLWNGYGGTTDWVSRQQNGVIVWAKVFLEPMSSVSTTVSDLFRGSQTYQNFINGPSWPLGDLNGTQSLAVVTSDIPVNVGVTRILMNPDQTQVLTPGFAFPLIPQQ